MKTEIPTLVIGWVIESLPGFRLRPCESGGQRWGVRNPMRVECTFNVKEARSIIALVKVEARKNLAEYQKANDTKNEAEIARTDPLTEYWLGIVSKLERAIPTTSKHDLFI